MTTRIIVILAGLLFSVTGLSALPIVITVNNPSFEITTGVNFIPCGLNCAVSEEQIPQWTSTVSTPTFQSGQFQPGPTPNQFFNFLPDGNTTAYNNGGPTGGTISQTVGDTVQNGLIYLLTVDLGSRLDFSPTAFQASANLVLTPLSGPPIVIPATGTPPALGNWSEYTATFTGTAATAGDSITIQLVSSGLQGNFDNVHLTAIPEPGSAGLLGLVGLPALAYFRRRRTAR